MFTFGMLREGPRGLHPLDASDDSDDDDIEDIAAYGIDWEAMAADHNATQRMERELADVVYGPRNVPRNLANVPCEPADCPLSDAQITALDAYLNHHYPARPTEMILRANLWSLALSFCRDMSDEFN